MEENIEVKQGDILRLTYNIEIGILKFWYSKSTIDKKIDDLIQKVREELPKKGLKIRSIDVDREKYVMVVEVEVVDEKKLQQQGLSAIPLVIIGGIILTIAATIGLSLVLTKVEKIVESVGKPIPALVILAILGTIVYFSIRRR
jgi:hypothetical protein